MPRAQINITADGVDEAGVLPTVTASDPTNDHFMENDGRTMLLCVNAMTSPVARQIALETTQKGVSVVKTVNTAAARDQPLVFSRIDPTFWNQKSGSDRGRVYINVDGTAADVKFYAIRKAANVS